MEVSFDALPFLYPESHRGELVAWRMAAVEREREIVLRRQAQLQQLQVYVQRRLGEIEAKRQLRSTAADQKPPCGGERSAQVGYTQPSTSSQHRREVEDDKTRSPLVGPATSGKTHTTAPLEDTASFPSSLTWTDGDPGNEDTLQTRFSPVGEAPSISSEEETVTHISELSLPDPGGYTSGVLPGREGLGYGGLAGPHTSPPTRRLFEDSESYSHHQPSRQEQPAKSIRDPCVRLTAAARGFLVRRLLGSEKVQDVVKTIKDASGVLHSLGTPSTAQDMALQQRVLTQLHVAKMTLHEIVFELPVEEKMAYIAHSRVVREERRLKQLSVSWSVSQPGKGRLSAATLRAMERRQRSLATPSTAGDRPTTKPVKPVGPAKREPVKPVGPAKREPVKPVGPAKREPIKRVGSVKQDKRVSSTQESRPRLGASASRARVSTVSSSRGRKVQRSRLT